MAGTSATRSAMASVSAASAHLPILQDPGPRFPGKDGGRSLAEMAYSDLDAALHLLAERAQYITGANGAAIALRRGQHNDMLCRASVGSNAPELGALLSMEYGLSGESVRTHKALRCDDTERDPAGEPRRLPPVGHCLGSGDAHRERAASARRLRTFFRQAASFRGARYFGLASLERDGGNRRETCRGDPDSARRRGAGITRKVSPPRQRLWSRPLRLSRQVTGTLPDVVQAPPVSLPPPELKPTTTETKLRPLPRSRCSGRPRCRIKAAPADPPRPRRRSPCLRC